jgi:lysophospholipid acyltransferase (LPLAT)-like uncharacterized protein
MRSDEGEEELSRSSRAVLFLAQGVFQLLARTWRFRVLNGGAIRALREQEPPVIFSLWHGQLLPLLWHHRNQGVKILISEHRDGEIVARTAQSLGYGLIRGSTTHGANRALITLVRELQAGHDVAITPDGPRGPAETYAPGALVAAQRTRAYIIPVAASASRSWRLNSWDRFMIPKPFARVTVAYAEPSQVIADSPRLATEQASRFKRLMGEAVALASG